MGLRSAEEKQPFLEERRQVEGVAEGWTFGAYLSGGVAVLAPPTAFFAVPLGVMCAAFAYAFKKRKAACDAIIDDPPRPDFDVDTRRQRGWFDPRRLEPPLSAAQIRLLDHLAEGDALLRAAVRADERAQGAYRESRLDRAETQARASDAFVDAYVSLQPETAELSEQVRDEVRLDPRWRSVRDAQPADVRPRARTLGEALSSGMVLNLAESGISLAALQEIQLQPTRAEWSRDPVLVIDVELSEYAAAQGARAERMTQLRERRRPLERLAEKNSEDHA